MFADESYHGIVETGGPENSGPEMVNHEIFHSREVRDAALLKAVCLKRLNTLTLCHELLCPLIF